MRWLGVITMILAFFSPAFARADEAGDQFAVAAGHYAAKRWKLAADEFQTFLDKNPKHADAGKCLFFQSESLLQLGRFDEVYAKLQEYLRREPSGIYARPAMFRSGEVAYLAKKTDVAVKVLSEFTKKYPDDRLNAFALAYLGSLSLSKKDYPLAESYYRESLDRFPDGGMADDCRFGLARSFEKQQKLAEAERLFVLLAEKPGCPLAESAAFHRGALEYAAGKYAESLETFLALERKWPKSTWIANAQLGSGWAMIKLGRLDEACAIFQSMSGDPKLGIEARYWLGLVQKSQKKWPEAAKTLLKTVAAAPKDHELLSAIRYHAGDALLQASEISAAVEQFDLVLAGEKNDARDACDTAKPTESSQFLANGSLLILPPANALLQDGPSETAGTEWIEQASRGKILASLIAKNYETVEREAENFVKRFPRSPFYLDVARIRARSLLEQKKFEQAAGALEPLFSYKLPPDEEAEIRYLLAAAEEGMRKFDRALGTLEPVFQSPSDRLKADALLLRGSILLAMHRYADAIAPLEKFLQSNPEGDGVVRAAGQLAICYARDKKIAKAKKIYADLAAKYPKHPLLAPAIEQLAQAAFDADDAAWSGELSAVLMELGKQKPGEKPSEYEIKGLAGIGWSQYKLGKYAEAAATFEQALQRKPSDDLAAELTFARGQTLEKLEQFDSALLLYDRAIENYPQAMQHPDAIYAAARLRMKLQQTREAAVLYSRLAADYPQYGKLDAALYDWAWTLRESNQLGEADKLYQRLRKDYPQSRFWADAVYRLAQRAFESEKPAEANLLLDELLAAKPEPAVREYALYLRAQVALQSKDWSKVRPAFARLIEEFPQNRERLLAEFWIAECDYRDKKIDEAEKQFDDIAKRTLGRKEPWMAMISLRRAQIALYRKNWDNAFRFASGIEQDFPQFGQQYEADLVVGRCLADRAEFEDARNAYRKVIHSPGGEKTETAAIAQWLIGETYFHQKNFEAAAREYLKVDILYAYPAWQSLALLETAKCQEQLNDFQQAESCYQRIADRYGTTPSAKPAKQRLAELKKERESRIE